MKIIGNASSRYLRYTNIRNCTPNTPTKKVPWGIKEVEEWAPNASENILNNKTKTSSFNGIIKSVLPFLEVSP